MKKLLLIVSILVCAFSLKAADVTALRVTVTDGKTETFVLNQQPKIYFEGADVVIVCNDAETRYARSVVRSFDFIKQQNSVDDIVADADNVVYTYDGEVFTCPDRHITVYTIGGMLFVDTMGSVSFADAPKGIYLVQVNNQTIKILR